MNPSRLSGLAVIAVCCLFVSSLSAQGPDVIVGDIVGVANYSSIGGIDAISVGTTSCNIGNANLLWISNTPEHPVIAQNLYRLDNGRFEQIGQSWLKHGFFALSQSLCDTCSPTSGSALGVGCSDPYSSSLNGSQSGLGPRFEVNASTGVFAYPFANPAGSTGNSIFKRLQFAEVDITPGAQFFVEAHYVTEDDATAGNKNNNASYRAITFSGSVGSGFSGSLGGSTVREQSAIYAWAANDASVELFELDIPNDGRIIVGVKSTDVGGGITEYEYAVYNMNSHASVQSTSVQMSSSANVSNIGFHDVAYHSGEPQVGTDWVGNHTGAAVTWATQTMAQNANANAIRWGNLFNFRFRSDMPAGDITLGLFRPGVGTPNSVTISMAIPQFSVQFPNGAPSEVAENVTTNVDISTTAITDSPDPSASFLYASVDGGAFVQSTLTDLGGGNFRAVLPAVPCYSVINWYVSLTSLSGMTTVNVPSDGPATTFESVAGGVAIVASDFESADGWTVTNDASLTAGAWDRAVPLGGGVRGDPATDSDGSGSCWVTDPAAGNTDVDDGATYLESPAFDLRIYDDPQFAFDFWYDNDFGTQVDDEFRIEISDDNGANWILVETVNTSNDEWNQRRIAVSDFVSLTATVRLRFVAEDAGSPSVVEAGVDNFRLLECRLMNEEFARGNVNENAGPITDVLFINGSAGGPLRRVNAGFGTPLEFSVATPPGSQTVTDWSITGTLGIPSPASAYSAGPLGTLAVFPCLANPQDPDLFILADNLIGPSACVPLLPAAPAPWVHIVPGGINGPFQFTIQGLIRDATDPLTISITNAVIYRTRSNL